MANNQVSTNIVISAHKIAMLTWLLHRCPAVNQKVDLFFTRATLETVRDRLMVAL